MPHAHAGRAAQHAAQPQYDDVVAEVKDFLAAASECGDSSRYPARSVGDRSGFRFRQDAGRITIEMLRHLDQFRASGRTGNGWLVAQVHAG